jgi:plastocyanin
VENSIKVPVAALAVAALLCIFTFGSIVARNSGPEGETLGDVPNGNYGGSRFYSRTVEQRLKVDADPSGALRWTQEVYIIAAGGVTFEVGNPSAIAHQFGIEGNGINYQSGNLAGRSTTILTIPDLPPGEYPIVCNFPGHREAGMVARLTVQ